MSQQSVEESMKKPKCYTAVITEGGFTLGIAVEGEPGYYKTDYPSVKTWDEAVEWAHAVNKRGGIDDKEEFRIVASSMAAQREAEETRERALLPDVRCGHCGEKLGEHSASALGRHLLMVWGVDERESKVERGRRRQAQAVDGDIDRSPDSDPDDYERDGGP